MKKVLGIVLGLMLISSMAMAAEWGFYGQSVIKADKTSEAIFTSTGKLTMDISNTSRLGTTVKVSDKLSGQVEFRLGAAAAEVRICQGTVKIGDADLLVGKTYSPANIFISNQIANGDADLLNIGGLYTGSNAMVQLSYQGLKVAALMPKATENLPELQASYTLALDKASILLVGAYEIDETAENAGMALGVGAVLPIDAAYIKGNYVMAKNNACLGNGGQWTVQNAAGEDETSTGLILLGGYKVSDMVTVEAGYGSLTITDFDPTTCIYVNAGLSVAEGLTITPEFGSVTPAIGDAITYISCKTAVNF